MKGWTVIATVAAAIVASSASAATAQVRVAAGSCPAPTVAAVVNETFVCLGVGGPCSPQFQGDYGKFGLTCTAARKLAKQSAGTSGAGLAEAFLNTKSSDFTTRMNSFKLGGPAPVLHLTFKQQLSAVHKVTVDVHNPKLDQTLDYTLQKGWQFTYENLPSQSANSTVGAYRITVTIDGAQAKQLYYSVKR